MSSWDVIVVGGGFAGVTAARELNRSGRSVCILEARDRLGGRTWVDRRLGHDLEIGGMWVHWLQPHVWAELSRYALGTVSSPTATRAIWIANGSRMEGSPKELFALLEEGSAATVADAADVFPQPYAPLAQRDRVLELDALSMAERLAATEMDETVRTLTEALWSLHFHCRLSEGALTQGLRWVALAAWSSELLNTACATYKIDGGTIALLEAMLADATATDVRLDTTVTAITQGVGQVTADLGSGESITARSVVVTVPRNVLHQIRFAPLLSSPKQAAAVEGQPSRGSKVWIRTRGNIEPTILMADLTHPFVWIQSEYWVGGDSIFVAFGIDQYAIDVDSRAEVQTAMRRWLPDVEVLGVTSHDWVADELSRGTWSMLRPGQLTRLHDGAIEAERSLYLAGSDYASGWAGFIDGAIESGLQVAARISSQLVL
jgi:monoamine oxidase